MIEELWKPVVRMSKVIPGYYVSNHGRIQNSDGKFLKINNRIRHQRPTASRISLQIPKNLFEDYTYAEQKNRKNSYKTRVSFEIHQLVIEAFGASAVDENPPIPKKDWEQCPESAKKFMRDRMVIDHIDDNPFNNHISNLRRVVPRDNNSHVKKHKLNDISRSGSDNSLV